MCKSQPPDDKPSLIGAWSGHVTHICWAPIISLEQLKPKVIRFCTQVGYINSSNWMTYYQQKGVVMVT